MRRAVDLLVVAFVVSVGLSTGSQLIEWWRVDSNASAPNLASLAGADFDWNRSPVMLEFGDASTSIERIPFRGGRKELDEALISIGKSTVNATESPRSAMEEAERGMLEALRTSPPVLWDSDRGNVYRRNEPLPSFIATRFIELTDDPVRDEQASLIQRIVGWGLAFPISDVNWTIYVFHPESSDAGTKRDQTGVVLPNGASNVTHLTGSNGCYWQVFQGRGNPLSWVQHFDEQFGAKSSTARTVETDTASLKYRHAGILTDIQIRREQDGRLTGVVWSAHEGETR